MSRATMAAVLAPTVASTAYVLELALVPLAMPGLESLFGLTRGELALVANVYGIAVALAVLAGGWLGGRLGALRVFLAGLACFTLGGVLVVAAADLPALLFGRLVQGIGGGLLSPSIPVLLTRASAGRPGRALALWNALSGFVVALAPLAGLPLVARFGWQAVFGVIALVAAAAVVLAVFARPAAAAADPVPPRRDRAAGGRWRLPGRWELFAYVGLSYGAILLFLFVVPLHQSAATAAGVGSGASGVASPAGVLGLFWASFTAAGLLLRNRFDGPQLGLFLAGSPVLIAAGFAVLLGPGGAGGLAWIAALLVGTGFAFGNAPSTVLILRHAPPGRATAAASLDITAARLGSVAVIGVFGAWPAEAMRPGVILVCLFCLATALPFLRDRGLPLHPAAPRP